MLNDRMMELRKKLSSLVHALLPMLAPFFLQVASSTFLMKSLPIPATLGSAVGLVISYLFGPIGFFVSAASWGTYLALGHPELLKNNLSLLFISSCVVSWWLSTLCSEHYQQRIVDFEEMIASLFKKNNEFEKQAKDTLLTLKEERRDHERHVQDLDAQVQDLQHQLSSHRHHLSLAWQESSMLKEEGEKQRKQLVSSYESAQSQSMFYLQQKQMTESALEQFRSEMEKLKQEKDEKQNQFLEEFNHLKQKIEEAQREMAEKENELQSLKEQINVLQAEKDKSMPAEAFTENSENGELAQYWETLYKQLRVQFDEKSDVLSETRKELFFIENQLLTLQKQEEDQAHDENEDQKNLICHLQNLGEECTDLEEQVTFLQEIVSSLQEKKKVSRPKNTKKSQEAAVSIEKLLESSKQSEENLFTLSE